MSISNLLFRFFLVYLTLLVIAGVVLSFLGAQSNGGVSAGALVGALFFVCMGFGKKNNRYFTKSEKLWVTLGLITVDIFVQLLFTLVYAAATNTDFSGSALLFSVGFIGLLHSLVIYFIVGRIGKTLVKSKVING